MIDILDFLTKLSRPRLLIRAARFGAKDYDRTRDLAHLIEQRTQTTPEKALSLLVEKEATLEHRRKSGDASYSVSKHVEVLIAVMGEARQLMTGPKAV